MIPNVVSHIKELFNPRFLILGKGPTFQYYDQIHKSDHLTIGINHVCEATKVNYAHIIDIEVIEHIGDKIDKNCDFLIMPFVPHERSKFKIDNKVIFWPSATTLLQWIERIPLLKRLHSEGRLLSYDLSSVDYLFYEPEFRVEVQSFSASTIVSMLSRCGIKEIAFLGVDGGNQYGATFDKYSKKTKLQTGQKSFNIQFNEIARIRQANDLNIQHLKWQKTNVILDYSEELVTMLQQHMISCRSSFSISFSRAALKDHFNIFVKGSYLPTGDLSLLSPVETEGLVVGSGKTVYDFLNDYSLTNYFQMQQPMLCYLISTGNYEILKRSVLNQNIRKSVLLQVNEGQIRAASALSLRVLTNDVGKISFLSFIKLVMDKILLPLVMLNKLIFDLVINKNFAYFNLLIIYSAIRKRLTTYGKL